MDRRAGLARDLNFLSYVAATSRGPRAERIAALPILDWENDLQIGTCCDGLGKCDYGKGFGDWGTRIHRLATV
jgi:hypothetical protein